MGAIWQTSSRNLRMESNFSGGINTEQEANFINDTESSEEYGFDTDNYPNLSVRKGRRAYGVTGGAKTNLMTSFKDLHLVRSVGTKLQYNNAGIWTDIPGTFANTDWSAANYEVNGADALILTNGTDAVKYWNGSALANLHTNAPIGRFITADPSRVFIAKGNVINFCAFQDPQDWTSAENSGSVQYYTYGGGDITALYNFRDIKYVWKTDSMAGLYGVSYFDYRLMEVSNNIGCVSHKTVQEVNGRLIWLGQQDVYIFTQGNPTPIGGKIRKYLNSINQAHIDKCCAFTDGLKYYLCLVTGNSTEPNVRLVYDTRFNAWRVPGINENYRYGTTFNNVMYVGDSSGMTYKVNEGADDDGVAITWSITSKAFNEGIGEAEKEYREMHVQGVFPTGTTLAVSMSGKDRGEEFTSIMYDPLSNPPEGTNKNLIVPLDTVPLSFWMRYRLNGSGPVTIYQVQRYFRLCRVQR